MLFSEFCAVCLEFTVLPSLKSEDRVPFCLPRTKIELGNLTKKMLEFVPQELDWVHAPVVQRVDSTIYWIIQ